MTRWFSLCSSVCFVANSDALDLPPLKTTISDFAGMFPPASAKNSKSGCTGSTPRPRTVAMLTVKSLDGDKHRRASAQKRSTCCPRSDTERNKTGC